jgi:S-formylglutathione hydrolase FrmB
VTGTGDPAQRHIFWRRRLILAAAALAAALVAWLAVRAIGDLVGPDEHGAETAEITIESEAVGEQLQISVVVPEGTEHDGERPMLVFLHGRDGNEDSFLVDEMYSALAELGDRAPLVAFPDGGGDSYWHDRTDGQWDQYVVDEVIPEVADRFDADPRWVAIGGVSMGGFGAYDLALHHPGRFCAVGGHAPALWETAGETAPGAFDDAEDFARNDVIAAARADPGAFTSQPVWLDAGDEDPFLAGDAAFTDALRVAGAPLTEKSWPGGHDSDYWDSHWGSYLRFYAEALRGCQ